LKKGEIMTLQARKMSVALASAAICVSFSTPAAAVAEKCPGAQYSVSSGKCDEVFGGNLSLPNGRPSELAAVVIGGDTAVTPAVPEPQTYALMLAGLGVVGLVAWRRKQR
jgi:hypothetical protein